MTGYGQQNCTIIGQLQKAGVRTIIYPTGLATKPEPLPENIASCLVTTPQENPTLLIQPPVYRLGNRKQNIAWFTVWETTRLPKTAVTNLNKSRVILTASEWNLSKFSACGVTAPIFKIPLFVQPAFTSQPVVQHSQFVFGCSGHLGAQAPRKNLDFAVQAFRKAFPSKDDVELRVKIGEFDQIHTYDDPRIKVHRGHLTTAEMVRWYSELNCFLHVSKSEGWGFQPLQAMAVGRPVIACCYGGVAEYFNSDCGLCLNYVEEPAEGLYDGEGTWAAPTLDSTVTSMLYAYEQPQEMQRLGVNGALKAQYFTPERTGQALLRVLQEYEIITTS